MDSEVYNILEAVAADLNLRVVETTTERSGYPKNLWYSLIGFRDETHYQDAQKALADAVADYKKGTQDQDGIACDLSVRAQVLQKRDGHDLWAVNQTTFCGLIDLFDLMHDKREDDRITAVYTAADADDEDDADHSDHHDGQSGHPRRKMKHKHTSIKPSESGSGRLQ